MKDLSLAFAYTSAEREFDDPMTVGEAAKTMAAQQRAERSAARKGIAEFELRQAHRKRLGGVKYGLAAFAA